MAEIKYSSVCSNCKHYRPLELEIDGRLHDYCKKIKIKVYRAGVCDKFTLSARCIQNNKIREKYNYREPE